MQSFLTRASIKTLKIPRSCIQVMYQLDALGVLYNILQYGLKELFQSAYSHYHSTETALT